VPQGDSDLSQADSDVSQGDFRRVSGRLRRVPGRPDRLRETQTRLRRLRRAREKTCLRETRRAQETRRASGMTQRRASGDQTCLRETQIFVTENRGPCALSELCPSRHESHAFHIALPRDRLSCVPMEAPRPARLRAQKPPPLPLVQSLQFWPSITAKPAPCRASASRHSPRGAIFGFIGPNGRGEGISTIKDLWLRSFCRRLREGARVAGMTSWNGPDEVRREDRLFCRIHFRRPMRNLTAEEYLHLFARRVPHSRPDTVGDLIGRCARPYRPD
jgi:hypothetical protein